MVTIDSKAYVKILDEDLEWLYKQPQTCERRHIEELLLREKQAIQVQAKVMPKAERCEHEWESCNAVQCEKCGMIIED